MRRGFGVPQAWAASTALLAAALAGGGCTLVGFGIGSAVDSHRAKLRPAPTWRLATIGLGTNVALQLDDGRRLEGKLEGTQIREASEYAPAYETARASRPEGLDLPELGACVLKEAKSGPEREVEWLGIDLQAIVIEAAGGRARLPFDQIGALRDRHGHVVSGPALQRLAETRQVPLLSAITLRGAGEPVAADRIVQIEAPSDKKRNGKLVGTLTGLAIDAVLVAVAAAQVEHSYSGCSTVSPTQGCTSCPFALSFDGTRYVRDAEVLGTSTLAAAQQADRAPLDHVADVGGQHRLRIANELWEVDEIDAVRILVADASPGTRVVAAPDGTLLPLTAPAAPRRVRDLRGRDVTPLVLRADGVPWVSTPWGRNPEDARDLRDGLVMDFDRPLDASATTLVFRIRSTTWAVELLTEALALHGPELPSWRDRMNGDRAARSAFFRALRREVLPSVSVWDGAHWRPAGVLTNLGPWLDRDQALRVPLEGVAGSTLRVRLESSPGLWIVDSVAADFGTPPSVEVTVLEARRADFHGRDVREVLREADGRRVTLRQGESLDLAFAAPPARVDRTRRVFLEATGFYTPLVPADREARPEEFEELVHQPGAIARWSLRLFAADLDRARSEER